MNFRRMLLIAAFIKKKQEKRLSYSAGGSSASNRYFSKAKHTNLVSHKGTPPRFFTIPFVKNSQGK
ncbi:MAG: hypothetical protein BGN96_16865 [Bacteroidales bacterium 45-6]|nr:MAG: hypothetical protein BGN96_16865 [Bacteroidales bacterium 45-6]